MKQYQFDTILEGILAILHELEPSLLLKVGIVIFVFLAIIGVISENWPKSEQSNKRVKRRKN